MVETHFSSDSYYRCVTTYEASHVIYTKCYCVVRQKRF